MDKVLLHLLICPVLFFIERSLFRRLIRTLFPHVLARNDGLQHSFWLKCRNIFIHTCSKMFKEELAFYNRLLTLWYLHPFLDNTMCSPKGCVKYRVGSWHKVQTYHQSVSAQHLLSLCCLVGKKTGRWTLSHGVVFTLQVCEVHVDCTKIRPRLRSRVNVSACWLES